MYFKLSTRECAILYSAAFIKDAIKIEKKIIKYEKNSLRASYRNMNAIEEKLSNPIYCRDKEYWRENTEYWKDSIRKHRRFIRQSSRRLSTLTKAYKIKMYNL